MQPCSMYMPQPSSTKTANSAGHGGLSAIMAKQNAIAMPPPAISHFSPRWASSQRTVSV